MSRAGPWIIALLASVLVNGLLAGFVWHRTSGGPDWNPARMERPHRPPPGFVRDQAPGPEGLRGERADGFNTRGFLASLPAEQRREAMSRFREEAPLVRQLTREAIEAQLEAQRALTADPFDPAAAQQALAEMRARQNAVQSHIEGVVVELVADLDPQTRREALEAGRRRLGELRDMRRRRQAEGG